MLLAATAAKDLDAVRGPDLPRLRRRIFSLEADPRPFGVKKLDGVLHRVRSGDWRVLYSIDDERRTIVVLRVLRRCERTYRGLRK